MREETEFRPKPMVEIGSRPILWHIMKTYAHYGFREFVLCLGYRGNMIKDYFLNYAEMNNDFTIKLGGPSGRQIEYHGTHGESDFSVTLADTGPDTMTGGRIRRIQRHIGGETFMVTYGDGLADIDIRKLAEFHKSHGRLATVTAVRPMSRFGTLAVTDSGGISGFSEKPRSDGWISAGFFVFQPDVFNYLDGDACVLEREPLERIAAGGQMMAYRHDGFFQQMDTYREYLYLNRALGGGQRPVENMARLNSFWTDRPVLVTGASGFLGYWLASGCTAPGPDVTCLVRDWAPRSELVRGGLVDSVKTVRGDVQDEQLMERVLGEYEIDTVFHLAAQTIVTIANRNPLSTLQSNIGGTCSVLEACRRSPTVKQIVVASSDKAYGEKEKLPYDECSSLQGRHPYDVSKSCADLVAQSYAATFGLPVAITRCGNFYGGGDLNWNRIVPGTIRSVLRGERPVIRSDGKYVRDYFYIEDGAAAYMLLAEKLAADPALAGQAFNFSNETQVTVLEMAERILKLMKSKLRPDVRNQAGSEIRRQYLSAAKARKVLGWRPAFDMDEGLKRTIAWYREFLGERK